MCCIGSFPQCRSGRDCFCRRWILTPPTTWRTRAAPPARLSGRSGREEAHDMAVKLGTAPDSWGVWNPADPLQTPWHRYLDEAVQAGYAWTELGPYGYQPTDPAVLRRELDARGLSLTGGTFGGPLSDPAAVPDLHEQVRKVGDLVGEVGGDTLVLL